ncbi:MAG TPA: metallophosphoesterase [Sedimentibacter sp.]|nr:metallophosphoesterase [Sedimentibacter sp.]HOK49852.1 metallophosphoesterase [Sedimentibacter sp.]HOW23518.1 metallophosphoesterase [Sedimentibacter sp.]
MKKILKIFGIMVILALILYSYARIVEPNLLTVKYENIYSPYVYDKDSLKIVQFSDTHISKYYDAEHLKKAVDKINAEKPDIVVFTGDLIERYNKYDNKDKIYEIWEALNEINAPLGKYAVYGNHDYGGGAERAFREIMEKGGFQILQNEKANISSYPVNIIGMDDSIFGTLDKETIISFLDEGTYNIILSHEPDVADLFLEYAADLFLTGHSHGGQVNLPVISYTPPLAQKYIRGMYDLNNYRQTKVYVNVGLGTSTLPLRFMAIPELTVITINGKK